MEEVSLTWWDVLFLPVALPLRAVGWTLSHIQEQAELAGDAGALVAARLLELETLHELGEVPDDAYEQERAALMTAWQWAERAQEEEAR